MAAITTAPPERLTHVGFSPRGAAALRAATQDWRTLLRTGALSSSQIRLLRQTLTPTLSQALRNGFTRAQAKVVWNI
jgi:hypothetical protein